MIQSLLDGGIQVTLYFQSLGDWPNGPMSAVSFLGTEEFYLLLLPILYWAIDRRLGLRVGVMLLLSGGLNTLLKWAFHLPRPYWYAAPVDGLWAESSFGVPSGHAQLPASIYTLIAATVKRGWYWAVTLVLVFLIGLSRVVLGAHFYFDVLGGWVVGFSLLWIFLRYEGSITSWLRGKSLARQIGWAFAISALLLVLGWLTLAATSAFEVPTAWVENALADQPEEHIAPQNFESIITPAATLFGLGAGAVWLNQSGWFNAGGVWWKRVVRVLLGVAGLLILWAGLDAVFPDNADLISYLLRYVRYSLVGFWTGGIAPLVFLRLRLADRE